MVSCTFVLIALVFWIYNFYMQRTSSLNFKKWDVSTVTAGDFTVEYVVSPVNWDAYINQHNAANNLRGGAEERMCLRDFSDYLIEQIEHRVQSVPWVVNSDETNITIAKISYAFNNDKMLGLLDKRGTLISNGKLD